MRISEGSARAVLRRTYPGQAIPDQMVQDFVTVLSGNPVTDPEGWDTAAEERYLAFEALGDSVALDIELMKG